MGFRIKSSGAEITIANNGLIKYRNNTYDCPKGYFKEDDII